MTIVQPRQKETIHKKKDWRIYAMKPMINVILRVISILCMVGLVIASIMAHKPIYTAVWIFASCTWSMQLIKYINEHKDSFKDK